MPRPKTITVGGETLSIAEWADRLGTSKQTIHNRIQGGWSEEEAVTTPIRAGRTGSPRHPGLSDQQVVELRRRRAEGASLQDVAEQFGVSPVTASRVSVGETYQSVGGPRKRERPRRGRRITHHGRTLTVPEWAEELGLKRGTLYERLRRMPVEEALTAESGPASWSTRQIVGAVRGAAEAWDSAGRGRHLDHQRRNDHIISRCFAAVAVLAEHPEGMQAVDLADRLGVSRQTAYRDLAALRLAGVGLAQDRDGPVVLWRLAAVDVGE